MDKKRTLIFYKSHFSEFFDKLPVKVQDKIDQVLYMVMVLERIPIKFFQHMKGTDGLYEIRVEFSSDIYRIFAVLMTVIWWCSSMVFRKRAKRHRKKK